MIDITVTPDPAASTTAYILDAITSQLQKGKSVLWMLSGGSAITAAAQVRAQLPDTSNLTVMLIDERYGEIGHPNSNWQQLTDAGFKWEGITALPTLHGKMMSETARDFKLNFDVARASADYAIALMGMGADGHTAGILPDSPATQGQMTYEGPDYQRITLLGDDLRFDEVVLLAAGQAKREQLRRFVTEDIDPAQQPVQYIKQSAHIMIITDQEGIE